MSHYAPIAIHPLHCPLATPPSKTIQIGASNQLHIHIHIHIHVNPSPQPVHQKTPSWMLCLADRFPFHVRLSPAAIELLSIRRESSCHKRMQEKVKKAHSTKSKKKIQIINKEMLLPAGAREMLLLLATLGSEGSHKNCTS